MRDVCTPAEMSVRGLVVPTGWSGEGKILHVSLLTADEGQIDLEADDQSLALAQAIRQEVVARIRVDESRSRFRRAKVLSFELVDDDEDQYVLEDLLREPDRNGW